jgi:hypothetical protein
MSGNGFIATMANCRFGPIPLKRAGIAAGALIGTAVAWPNQAIG